MVCENSTYILSFFIAQDAADRRASGYERVFSFGVVDLPRKWIGACLPYFSWQRMLATPSVVTSRYRKYGRPGLAMVSSSRLLNISQICCRAA